MGFVREVAFRGGDVELAGTLVVPDGGGPGVVMVGGSGPSDRDNDTHFPPVKRHPDRDPRATLTVEVLPHANHRLPVDGHPAPGCLDALTRWITTAP